MVVPRSFDLGRGLAILFRNFGLGRWGRVDGPAIRSGLESAAEAAAAAARAALAATTTFGGRPRRFGKVGSMRWLLSRGSDSENWPVWGKWELVRAEVDGLERVRLLEPEGFGWEEDEAATLSLSEGSSPGF